MSSGTPRVVGNMYVFVACQIDVVNKQLLSPLSWKPVIRNIIRWIIYTDYLQTSRIQGKTPLGCWGS